MGAWKRFRRRFRPISRGLRRSLRPPDYRELQKRVAAIEANQAGVLASRYASLAGGVSARDRLRSREFKVFSQNGEDGLLLYLFSVIGTTNRRVIEFGMGDGRECNSANLILNFGWGGLLMDCAPRNVGRARQFYADRRVLGERLRVEEAAVTAENADALFEEFGVKGELDLLSIDIDGNDYWVWRAIGVVRPRVVVIEYNASLGVSERLICRYEPDFDSRAVHSSGWYHGASLAAMTALGARSGYRLVGCDSSGVNAFFLRADLAADEIATLGVAEAYYPHARRLARASADEQLALLRGLPFERDDES